MFFLERSAFRHSLYSGRLSLKGGSLSVALPRSFFFVTIITEQSSTLYAHPFLYGVVSEGSLVASYTVQSLVDD